jgi:hypothetical protein
MVKNQSLQMPLMILDSEPVRAGARVTGAAMDRPLPKRRPNYVIAAIVALLLLGGIAVVAQLIAWIAMALKPAVVLRT